jgi:hypothetical protein
MTTRRETAMKLAVLGGTGLAGSAVVEQAVERGHHVRALVRSSTNPPRALVEADIVRGDALDPDAVARTISGADAVVSSLGGYRGPASIAAGTQNIITAMRRTGPDRLVILQGFHIDFPGDPRNPGKHLIKAFLALRCRPLLEHGGALGGLSYGRILANVAAVAVLAGVCFAGPGLVLLARRPA